jgi:hypothetical protein
MAIGDPFLHHAADRPIFAGVNLGPMKPDRPRIRARQQEAVDRIPAVPGGMQRLAERTTDASQKIKIGRAGRGAGDSA